MATLPNKNPLADLSGGYYAYWTDGTTEGRATLAVILGSTDAQAAAAALGSLTLGTDLAVAHGGTGASTASDARDNLGLTIGTNVQAWDADLDAIAALDPSANKIIYKGGGANWETATLTSFARTLIDDSNAATARATLGVDAAGTDNSTDVTIAAGLDYITISGQELTLGSVDLTTDVTGALPDGNIATAANWNTAYTHSQVTSGNPHSVTKSDVGLGNVENTALSTWAGSANITTLGTIGTGVWQGTAIANAYVAGIDQNLLTTSSPTFAGLTVNGDIAVGATTNTVRSNDYAVVGSATNMTFTGGGLALDVVFLNGASASETVRFDGSASSVIIASDLTLAAGSITSASGAISFGNENLSTTGIATFDGFRNSGTNANYNLLARNSVNTALYVQNGSTGIIADFRYGDMTVGGGTSMMEVGQSGVTITGTLSAGATTVSTGSSGATASTDADDLTVEGSGNAGISILSGASNLGNIYFADSGGAFRGFVQYSHVSDQLRLGSAAATALTLDSSQNATFAGDLTLSSGDLTLAATQRLYLDGGNNTYIYERVDNEIAFVTGNGQRAKIDSNGLTVQSGTFTSEVGATISSGNLTLSSGDLFVTGSLYAVGASNGSDGLLTLEAIGDSGQTTQQVSIRAEASNTNGGQLFFATDTSGGVLTDRMSINRDGHVSVLTGDVYVEAGDLRIGTTSATSHGGEVLRVEGTGGSNSLVNIHSNNSFSPLLQFTNTTTGTAAADGFVIGISSSEEALLYNAESTAMRFATANTERFRVASDAYAIGIGTTDVESWTSTHGAIEFGQSAISGLTNSDEMNLMTAAYNSGGWKYKNGTASPTLLQIQSGAFKWYTAASGAADSAIAWSQKMTLTNAGMLLVGDTANANMTVGLTINQGANDDEILAFKSSDVGHGLTSQAETDTFALFRKSGGDQGGLRVYSFAEDHAGADSLQFQAYGGTASTTKTTSALGLIDFYASEHNGAGSTSSIAADGVVFSVRANVSGTRALFIIDEDGDYFYDGADGGAFDVYEDAHLVRAFANATSKETVRTAHDDWVQYNEQTLVDIGVLGAPVSEGGLINGAQLQRVHTGAIWQNYMAISDTKTEVEVLRSELADTKSRLAIAESKLKQLPQA